MEDLDGTRESDGRDPQIAARRDETDPRAAERTNRLDEFAFGHDQYAFGHDQCTPGSDARRVVTTNRSFRNPNGDGHRGTGWNRARNDASVAQLRRAPTPRRAVRKRHQRASDSDRSDRAPLTATFQPPGFDRPLPSTRT